MKTRLEEGVEREEELDLECKLRPKKAMTVPVDGVHPQCLGLPSQ